MSAPLHAGQPPVALVTGANHGIGAATARALARGGEEVAAAIRAGGGTAVAVPGDLGRDGAVAELFDRAEAALGPVRILVNNASSWTADTFVPGAADDVGRRPPPVDPSTLDRQFAVDARAGGLLIAELARRHVARGGRWGRIVSLTSGGPLGFPGEVSYGAAKAALESYTMSAALELADHGVTANVLLPPVTDTGWVDDAVRAFVAGSREHVHVATPEQVAEVIAWLCSDAAALVTANRIVLR